jgi:hypothetical protein
LQDEKETKGRKEQVELQIAYAAAMRNQIILTPGAKLAHQDLPQAPPDMLPLSAITTQRISQIFDIPPGLQRELNPFAGKSAAEDGAGVGSGAGSGQTVGRLSPAAEIWNRAIRRKIDLMERAFNSALSFFSLSERSALAFISRSSDTASETDKRPENWGYQIKVPGAPVLAVIQSLWSMKIVKYDYFKLSIMATHGLPAEAFEEEEPERPNDREERMQTEQAATKKQKTTK